MTTGENPWDTLLSEMTDTDRLMSRGLTLTYERMKKPSNGSQGQQGSAEDEGGRKKETEADGEHQV